MRRSRRCSSPRGSFHEPRHPGHRRRDERAQDRRLRPRPRQALRGQAHLCAPHLRPGQGGHRARCMVGGTPRMLRRVRRQPCRSRCRLPVRDDAGTDAHGRRRHVARAGSAVPRRTLACPIGRDSRPRWREEVPRRDVQSSRVGWLVAVVHPLVPGRDAGGLGGGREVRPLQHLSRQADDGPVGDRSFDGLDHRPLQHGPQRPHLEPGGPRPRTHSRREATTARALPRAGRSPAACGRR